MKFQWGAGLSMAAVLAAVTFAATADATAAKFKRQVDLGDAAPVWHELEGIDGKKHGLADHKEAKLVVVAFTCNRCPVAAAYEARFIAFVNKYADRGVAFVAISCSNERIDRLDKMKERAAKKGYNFSYLHDPGQKVGRAYGATVTPHLFVLDGDRKIAYMGAFDNNMDPSKVERDYLREAVDSLLTGEQPEIGETLQFGCAIDYSSR